MFDKLFAQETIEETIRIVQNEFPLGIWETVYVTVIATAIAIAIGLPLGVLLVTTLDRVFAAPSQGRDAGAECGDQSAAFRALPDPDDYGISPSRLIVGTTVGTVASIVPLVIASFPFVARLVESSLREVNPNIIEMAQSMALPASDHHEGDDSGERALPAFQFHHRDHDHPGLFCHERRHRRRAAWARSPSATAITVTSTW